MLALLAAVAFAEPLVAPPAPAAWFEPAFGIFGGCLWESPPDPLGLVTIRAVADGTALLASPAGSFRVSVEHGVERVYPPGIVWAGLGTHGAPWVLADGHVAPFDGSTSFPADMADVAPGILALVSGGIAEIRTEPDGRLLGALRVANATAVFALPDGRAVLDIPGPGLVLWDSRGWSWIPRPPGTLTRYGGRLEARSLPQIVALDTAGAWQGVGSGGGASREDRWWLDQVRRDDNLDPPPSVNADAPHLDSTWPPPPDHRGKHPLILQQIGTNGATDSNVVVHDTLGDDRPLGDTPPWGLLAPFDGRVWWPRVRILGDGIRDADGWRRLPHVLLTQRDAAPRLADLPPGCAPLVAETLAGLPLLHCRDGAGDRVWSWSDGWRAEVTLPRDAGFQVAPDGTLLAAIADAAWVRPPGGGWWTRTVHGVSAWRVAPSGTALAVTLVGSMLHVDAWRSGRWIGRRSTLLPSPPRAPGDTSALDVRVDGDHLVVVRYVAGGYRLWEEPLVTLPP
jgi:hypothetical protein